MTQVQTMTNQEFNRALAELMGYTVEQTHDVIDGGGAPWYRLIGPNFGGRYDRNPDKTWLSVPDYCTDPAASLEVQTAAIAKDTLGYVHALADVMVIDIRSRTLNSISRLISASPRERAEAAYITLSQAAQK